MNEPIVKLLFALCLKSDVTCNSVLSQDYTVDDLSNRCLSQYLRARSIIVKRELISILKVIKNNPTKLFIFWWCEIISSGFISHRLIFKRDKYFKLL